MGLVVHGDNISYLVVLPLDLLNPNLLLQRFCLPLFGDGKASFRCLSLALQLVGRSKRLEEKDLYSERAITSPLDRKYWVDTVEEEGSDRKYWRTSACLVGGRVGQ